MKKLSVHLVTWNGAKYIPHLFESLRKQTYTNWNLVVLDNCSDDNTAEVIEKELGNFSVQYFFKKYKKNTGFAGGHNLLFQETDSEYVLLLNQDMYLTSNCFEQLVAYADAHKNIAAVSPRLMRWNFSAVKDDPSQGFTDHIDALGLKVFRSRRVIEQYTKQTWTQTKHIFDTDVLDVFGVSGAFPLLRTSLVKQVVFEDGSLFDESYHAYKEDVDLAFRLRAAGYSASVLLDVVAYHDRTGAGAKRLSDRASIQNKKKQSPWVTYHSYKNHLVTLYKNEYLQNLLLDLPWIVWYELKKFLYFLIFDIRVVKGLSEIWSSRVEIEKRRLYIKDKRTVNALTMRHWWT